MYNRFSSSNFLSIKNIFLCFSLGHIHLTDFNIATYVPEGKIAISLSGTRPYLAPEVFLSNIEKMPGYSFEADWWSWGITLCELVRGKVSFINSQFLFFLN
jgi:Serine/threonine protein kinase